MAKVAKKKTKTQRRKIQINDECWVELRGSTWQFHMYLSSEGRYDRASLQTTNEEEAIVRANNRYGRNKYALSEGLRIFSLTLEQAVEAYLEHRLNDVYDRPGSPVEGLVAGNIKYSRWKTIRYQLNSFLSVYGPKTKLSHLDGGSGERYLSERQKKGAVSLTTIRNEQAIINNMMKWLYSKNHTACEKLIFPPIRNASNDDLAEKKDTFSREEAKRLQDVLAQRLGVPIGMLVSRRDRVEFIMSAFFLLTLNTGLRTGEQKQLKWAQVERKYFAIRDKGFEGIIDLENEEDDTKTVELVMMTILASTSKKNETRKVATSLVHIFDSLEAFSNMDLGSTVVSGQRASIEKLRRLQQRYVFSVDGEKPLRNDQLSKFFKELLEEADIKAGKRRLVPYKCRHYYITQLVSMGRSAEEIAKLVGTSINEIEKTYYRVRKEDVIEAVMPGMVLRDGVLIRTK